ncbi:hypothetical protein C8Q74DRAFT_1248706 [Fomes fomentarius]|nr:hypothetical protein C8Q74DRAFT_1248706 [Fomes fomentarius]
MRHGGCYTQRVLTVGREISRRYAQSVQHLGNPNEAEPWPPMHRMATLPERSAFAPITLTDSEDIAKNPRDELTARTLLLHSLLMEIEGDDGGSMASESSESSTGSPMPCRVVFATPTPTHLTDDDAIEHDSFFDDGEELQSTSTTSPRLLLTSLQGGWGKPPTSEPSLADLGREWYATCGQNLGVSLPIGNKTTRGGSADCGEPLFRRPAWDCR